jgi:hypothetical protein
MYQPKIRDDQVRQLYLLAKSAKKPMTKLIREAVDEFLAKNGKEVNRDEDLYPGRTGSSIGRNS